ncbi:unnamed protein product [Moneuplotes crassus]|uniref:Uncharacterized protein n=1 Tax=Euplotes crassus TaxID=5936 RepID=A0AAD1XSZ8_EUPCR|nr:unnamed protein product [Moneuplotes crassus]
MNNYGDDEIMEEIQDRINVIKANIETIEGNLEDDSSANIMSLNIEVYIKNKKKMMTLINQNLKKTGDSSESPEERAKNKAISEFKEEATRICNTFETRTDLEALKEKVKESQEIDPTGLGFAKTEDIEKMMGDFREAALVINHENRKQKAADGSREEYKNGEKFSSSKKNKEKGMPKSLRMIDLESEKYQQQQRKKVEAIPIKEREPSEDLENKTCGKCVIF